MNSLPIIKINSKFYVDIRLKELRDINNPHHRIKFDEIRDIELLDKVEEILYKPYLTKGAYNG